MDDSESSSDDNDHTPKRKGSRKRSGFDDSPISNISFGSESPVVPWDFPRPKVSRKVKEAAKELGQMMNQVCSKRKRQKIIKRPEIPIDPLSSPVSRYQSRTSLVDKYDASIDFEALEKTESGLDSSMSSLNRPLLNPRTSPVLNHHKKFKFNLNETPKAMLISDIIKEEPKNLERINEKTESEPKENEKPKWALKTGINSTKSKFGSSKFSEKKSQDSAQKNKNSQLEPKEEQKPTPPKVSSVQELLEEDMCFFLTPELASL